MLKKLTLLLGLACFIAVSCTKKEDVSPASIIGKWTLSAIDIKLDKIAVPVTSKAIAETLLKSSTYDFTADGKFTFTYSDGDKFSGTYKMLNSNKSIEITDEFGDKYNYNVLINGSKLELSSKEVELTKFSNFDLNDESEDGTIIFEIFILSQDQEAKFEKIVTDNKTKFASVVYKYSK